MPYSPTSRINTLDDEEPPEFDDYESESDSEEFKGLFNTAAIGASIRKSPGGARPASCTKMQGYGNANCLTEFEPMRSKNDELFTVSPDPIENEHLRKASLTREVTVRRACSINCTDQSNVSQALVRKEKSLIKHHEEKHEPPPENYVKVIHSARQRQLNQIHSKVSTEVGRKARSPGRIAELARPKHVITKKADQDSIPARPPWRPSSPSTRKSTTTFSCSTRRSSPPPKGLGRGRSQQNVYRSPARKHSISQTTTETVNFDDVIQREDSPSYRRTIQFSRTPLGHPTQVKTVQSMDKSMHLDKPSAQHVEEIMDTKRAAALGLNFVRKHLIGSNTRSAPIKNADGTSSPNHLRPYTAARATPTAAEDHDTNDSAAYQGMSAGDMGGRPKSREAPIPPGDYGPFPDAFPNLPLIPNQAHRCCASYKRGMVFKAHWCKGQACKSESRSTISTADPNTTVDILLFAVYAITVVLCFLLSATLLTDDHRALMKYKANPYPKVVGVIPPVPTFDSWGDYISYYLYESNPKK